MGLILGIDPGMLGGAALLAANHQSTETINFKQKTPAQIIYWLKYYKGQELKCYLEGVGARPTDGVVPAFKFGQNYGWWQGVLDVLEIPVVRVYPLKWQTAMGCRTGGNKNISKAAAKKLFPYLKITHANADALLIAEYGYRKEQGWFDL